MRAEKEMRATSSGNAVGKHLALGLLFISALVAGCAAKLPPRQSTSSEVPKQDFANARAFCAGLYAAPSLDPIRQLVSSSDDPPTFDMLSNQARATREEQPVIREWAYKVMACQARITAVARTYLTPMHLTLLTSAGDASNALRAALHNSQITYGDYNQRRQRTRSDYELATARLNAELARQDAEARYRAQQVAQQQYSNFLSLQQTLHSQQQLWQQRANQHGAVTCTNVGASTYCNY